MLASSISGFVIFLIPIHARLEAPGVDATYSLIFFFQHVMKAYIHAVCMYYCETTHIWGNRGKEMRVRVLLKRMQKMSVECLQRAEGGKKFGI